jgi:hypothetical protein
VLNLPLKRVKTGIESSTGRAGWHLSHNIRWGPFAMFPGLGGWNCRKEKFMEDNYEPGAVGPGGTDSEDAQVYKE